MPTLTSPDMKVDNSAVAARGAERALVAEFRQGCPQATELLFNQLAGPVRATLHRLLGWPDNRNEEIEDIVQNVFLAAWQHRRTFRGSSSFKTWITRIAINECRRVQRRQWLRDKWWIRTTALTLPRSAEIDDSISRHEITQLVQQAIQALKQHEREVVVLYYLEHMTAHAIAETLGVRQNTVEVRLSRARRRLAGQLGELQ